MLPEDTGDGVIIVSLAVTATAAVGARAVGEAIAGADVLEAAAVGLAGAGVDKRSTFCSLLQPTRNTKVNRTNKMAGTFSVLFIDHQDLQTALLRRGVSSQFSCATSSPKFLEKKTLFHIGIKTEST
jgi:hypothetical protein